MSPRIVQVRLATADASSAAVRAVAATEWRRALELRVATSCTWSAACARALGVEASTALQDLGDRTVFAVEHAAPERITAMIAALERDALALAKGRVVPVVAVIDGEPSADAHAMVTALEAADRRAARSPFSTLLRDPAAFGPLQDDDASDAPHDDGAAARAVPLASVAIALDPLRPAPVGEHGACSFLTWSLLQQTGHDLLDGIATQHAAEFAPRRALVCGERAVFDVDLRHALAFADAVARDASEHWRTSVSIAIAFARDERGSDSAAQRAWSALSEATARGDRSSLIVDDVRLDLATIGRQREWATGLEALARRAPGPMRELALAAARLTRNRATLDIGELSRLRGAIHAVAARAGVNARRTRGQTSSDPAIAALSALIAESARGFESGEAVLPLSYAVWMSSMPATETT